MRSAEQTAQAIIQALNQENNPTAVLIKLYLEKWEIEIRKDQLEIDHKNSLKIVKETFNK